MRKIEIDKEKIGAMRRAITLGRTLQDEVGEEIRSLYVGGQNVSDIVDKLNVQKLYGPITINVARTAVYKAIIGYQGELRGISPYQGLIDGKDELKKLGRDHIRKVGGMNGRKIFEQKIGVHGRSLEQMREDGRKAGSLSGPKNFRSGLGIHAQTHEQKVELGREAALTRGEVIWTDRELRDLYELSQQEDYRHRVGTHKGKPNHKLITEEINRRWHNSNNVRTRCTIGTILSKIRRIYEEVRAK